MKANGILKLFAVVFCSLLVASPSFAKTRALQWSPVAVGITEERAASINAHKKSAANKAELADIMTQLAGAAQHEAENAAETVSKHGVEAFATAVRSYCETRNFTCQDGSAPDVFNVFCRSPKDSDSTVVVRSYRFDDKNNICTATLSVPQLKVSAEASAQYNEQCPRDLEQLGLIVSDSDSTLYGYNGRRVRDVRPLSLADRSGFEKNDQIIQINYADMNENYASEMKSAIKRLRDKAPVTVKVVRGGYVREIFMRP